MPKLRLSKRNFAGENQTFLRPLKLRVGKSQLQTKGDGFRVNAMAAANAGRILVFKSPLLQRRQQTIQILQKQISRPRQLDTETRIEDI